ncbi:DTMP kinase [Maritalea myrionectae]|uniref:dTMP kinase n=1 Tax=Maritalea myrionectae TaxID=454601 RepID=A0A2R4MCN0_9HYPH|nr:MFS transporter [Maritalea myrionectae]AVX03733.1 DTMP kinase [Maritalea myrionectae]
MRLPKNKNMRRILAAQLPADFADWLDYVAVITLFTYVWQVDTIYFAWFAVSFSLPYILVGPLAGALVDRSDLKSVLVLSNLGRALSTFSLIFASQPEIMLALIALRSSIDSFFSPAKQVAIQALVERDELMATNSVSHVINQASKVAGPAVGGALLIWVSPQAVFGVNGAVSLLAMAIFMTLPRKIEAKQTEDHDAQQEAGGKASMLNDILSGFAIVFSTPALWTTIMLGAMGFFAIFLHDTLIGPVTRELGFDATILGISVAAVGGGGILGAVTLGSMKRHIHPFLLIGPSMIIVSAMTMLLGSVAIYGWSIHPYIFVAAFFVVGFVGTGTFVPLRTVLQLETPSGKMGRVTAVNESLSLIAMISAPFIGATLASIYHIGVPFVFGGTITLVLGIVALILIKFVPFTSPEDAPDLPKTAETV